jgi:hypothetical protein
MATKQDPSTITPEEGLDSCLHILKQYEQLAQLGHDYLARYRESLAGEVVFCLGTGPSLRDLDPCCLEGLNLIATNHALRIAARSKVQSIFSIVTDNQRLTELAPELHNCGWPAFVAPHPLTKDWMEVPNLGKSIQVLRTTQFVEKRSNTWTIAAKDSIGCEFNLAHTLDHCGQSVIFAAIQLAYFLGATTVVLLGVDMDYSRSARHFAENISTPYPSFSYETHARNAFVHFRRALQDRGVQLFNATPRSRVDVIRRIKLATALAVSHRTNGLLRQLREQTVALSARLEESHRTLRLVEWLRSLTDRPVVLWGAGAAGRQVAAALDKWGFRYHSVVDGNPAKAGTRLGAARVEAPNRLFQLDPKPFVLICSQFDAEVTRELVAAGFQPRLDFEDGRLLVANSTTCGRDIGDDSSV